MSLTRSGHQTGTAYSRIGRTRDKCGVDKPFTLVLPTERLIKPNRLIRDSRLVVLYQSGVDCSAWLDNPDSYL